MIVTKQDLERFHEFAMSRLAKGDSDFTWRQLFEMWRQQNPTDKEYAEDVAAIQQSLDSMSAGQLRPFADFDADFRARHGIVDEK